MLTRNPKVEVDEVIAVGINTYRHGVGVNEKFGNIYMCKCFHMRRWTQMGC
jgi:hypothetical protein